MWLLLCFALASVPSEEVEPPPLEQHFQQVVFPRQPKKKLRIKLIRKAFKGSNTLQGGKDWGRVMCFIFNGEPEPGVLDVALRKAHLVGLIRPATDCSTPPGEAYIPPEPESVRRLTLIETTEPLLARQALSFVLTDDNGISGIHVASESSPYVCLELERDLKTSELEQILSTSSIPVVEISPAPDCRDALGFDR